MLKHHITKYSDEAGNRYAVSWLQVNLFGTCHCLSQKRMALK
ncbi:hypothetical protein [Listeria sp. ILCC792]|nr:hypothetical protein [Listeria sp. ILCC792]